MNIWAHLVLKENNERNNAALLQLCAFRILRNALKAKASLIFKLFFEKIPLSLKKTSKGVVSNTVYKINSSPLGALYLCVFMVICVNYILKVGLYPPKISKLKGRYTIGNCQRPVFSLRVSQHMHKITNL